MVFCVCWCLASEVCWNASPDRVFRSNKYQLSWSYGNDGKLLNRTLARVLGVGGGCFWGGMQTNIPRNKLLAQCTETHTRAHTHALEHTPSLAERNEQANGRE